MLSRRHRQTAQEKFRNMIWLFCIMKVSLKMEQNSTQGTYMFLSALLPYLFCYIFFNYDEHIDTSNLQNIKNSPRPYCIIVLLLKFYFPPVFFFISKYDTNTCLPMIIKECNLSILHLFSALL